MPNQATTPRSGLLIVLLCFTIHSTALAQATFRDTVAVTLSDHVLLRLIPEGCQLYVWTIGTHRDVVGRGLDGDYRYTGTVAGQPRVFYYENSVPDWTGAPNDAAGEVISYTEKASWSLGPACDFGIIGRVAALTQSTRAFATFSNFKHPVAIGEWHKNGGLKVAFDGSESYVATSTGHVPVASYEWDFGNGTTATTASQIVEYDQPGTYTVSLKVTDDEQQEDVLTMEVEAGGPQLLIYSRVSQDNVSYGDSLDFIGFVYNEGTEDAKNVLIPNVFDIDITYDVVDPTLVQRHGQPASGASTPITNIPSLAPGELRMIQRRYGAPARPTEYPSPDGLYEIPEYYEVDLASVTYEDANGKRGKIRRQCETEECANKVKVNAIVLDVELKLFDESGEVTTMGAGRRRRARSNGNGWITDHRFVKLEDLTSYCISGCVGVEVLVKDESGVPLEGTKVTLSATDVAGDAVVTPEQGGGFFCTEDAVDKCSKTLVIEATDSEGKARAIYWFPGVKASLQTTVKAEADHGVEGNGNATRPLTIEPTPIEFGSHSVDPTQDDILALQLADLLVVGTSVPNVLGDGCKSIQKTLLGKARVNVDVEFIDGLAFASDFVCAKAFKALEDKVSIPDWFVLFDAAKKLAEYAELYWFLNEFNVPGVGLGQLSVASPAPPFLDLESDFHGAVTGSLADLGSSQRLAAFSPSTWTLDMHEVSYRKIVSGTSAEVPALYFSLKVGNRNGAPYEKSALVQAGYAPGLFLTEKGVVVAGIDQAASSNATEVSLSSSSVAAAKRAAIRSTGIDSLLFPGHVLVIDPDASARETVQVESILGSIVSLTTPLRYDHAAGVPVVKVDSVALASPSPPAALGYAAGMPGVGTDALLEWRTRTPAFTFDFQLSTDSLFSSTQIDEAGFDSDSILVSDLTLNEDYFWRVRGANSFGKGDWSRTFAFRTGGPTADNLINAAPTTVAADAVSRWVVAATSEPSESQPSCGLAPNSIWLSFTAAETGMTALHTLGSSFDTILSVWTGAGHPLDEIACNDDWDTPDGKHFVQSALEFQASAGTTYLVRIAGKDGAEGIANVRLTETLPVSVDAELLPDADELSVSAYPNPGLGRVSIAVTQPTEGRLIVDVFDVTGRRLMNLSDSFRGTGRQEFVFDGSLHPAGLYFVRAVSGRQVSTTKLLLLH
ncbi:MAG: T9SS type A sorting domain-containing protein [Bacteroidetes bacterium]|nr:T9SS type A sorting domain-containing protein [Bacteroidota bacterium]